MVTKQHRPYCVGAPAFSPASRVQDSDARTQALNLLLLENDFAAAIKAYFQLPQNDTYVYRAVANVTLPQVQHVVSLGAANGLHAWYGNGNNNTEGAVSSPTKADIEAYLTIFQPTSLTPSALKAFASNAKRGSIRASVAAHLLEKRYIHPSPSATAAALQIPKKKPTAVKNIPANPYFDFWTWSCLNLEWCGPCPESEARSQSHHVLPVLMHHFGCAIPSYESLEIMKVIAEGRTVVDMGSGNGYWAFMLRQHGVAVQPVDNAQSDWRVNWIDDTLIMDGVKFLSQSKQNEGGKDMVLLMVYPVVGGSLTGTQQGGFTRGLMAAYKGDTVAVVGTQNGNGYTGFKDMTFDQYMEREQPGWTKVVQIPVPSFAGKDEALYVYQRGERANKLVAA